MRILREINGETYELTAEDKDPEIPFYDYCLDKCDLVLTCRPQDAICDDYEQPGKVHYFKKLKQ